MPLTWSGSFIAGKYAAHELPPLTVTLVRFLVCLAVLLPMLPRVQKGHRLTRRDYAACAGLGMLGVVAYHFFYFAGLKHTTPSMAAVVLQTNPILINIGAAWFLGETIRARTYIGAVVAFAGIVVLALARGGWTFDGWGLGETFILLGSLAWVVYTLAARPVVQRHSALLVSIYSFIFGTVVLVPCAWLEGGLAQLGDVSGRVWASLVYMGLFANVVGYVVYNYCVKHLGAGRAALFTLLVPVLAAVLDRLFFGNPITGVKIAAIVMVLFGVWLAIARPARA